MKQTVSKQTIVGILFFAGWLAACESVAGQVSYHPLGIPLKISVNTWGELEIEASGEIVTPIGVFEAGLVADPVSFFDGVQNTLVVRIGPQECWYDLNGKDFDVQLTPGYYQQMLRGRFVRSVSCAAALNICSRERVKEPGSCRGLERNRIRPQICANESNFRQKTNFPGIPM